MAVINVSGGLRSESCAAVTEDALVTAVRAFGVKSRVPSLWVYAKNDSFFGPDLVERMRSAFLEGGGDAKLVMLEPEGKDGHAIFSTPGGRAKWLPEMDGFFRYRKLPTWTRIDVDALMQKLNTKNRELAESYIAGPSEKVLAREKGGSYLNGSQGMPTTDLARQRGLTACQRTKPECEIIMENDHWVASGP